MMEDELDVDFGVGSRASLIWNGDVERAFLIKFDTLCLIGLDKYNTIS